MRLRRKSRYRVQSQLHTSGCILVAWIVYLLFLIGSIVSGNMGAIIASSSVGIMLSIYSLSESMRRRA